MYRIYHLIDGDVPGGSKDHPPTFRLLSLIAADEDALGLQHEGLSAT